jgi:hypothetical protein
MRIAYVNRPEGKGYARAFAQLMEHDGLDTMQLADLGAAAGGEGAKNALWRTFRLAVRAAGTVERSHQLPSGSSCCAVSRKYVPSGP